MGWYMVYGYGMALCRFVYGMVIYGIGIFIGIARRWRWMDYKRRWMIAEPVEIHIVINDLQRKSS